ncbi:histone-lysine N-methyltransferase ASHR3 [Amborella trichopoda]|uniref:histone-lysine N-methyltransferase ASHR3 n=1 Tax=Amborella trichopoda TaxID=13333 RepID=UPI0009C0453C|nr:histone-lysine N-methyltransferase ASHR3 [Amborella trichopoda]|eukprot:XP_020523670.1 histone-lysine N-methyltransferase ASHR3 [Amborella trichopoda]
MPDLSSFSESCNPLPLSLELAAPDNLLTKSQTSEQNAFSLIPHDDPLALNSKSNGKFCLDESWLFKWGRPWKCSSNVFKVFEDDGGFPKEVSEKASLRCSRKAMARCELQKNEVTSTQCRTGKSAINKSFEELFRAWVEKKVKSGVPESECNFPFLVHAPRMVECRICCTQIVAGKELLCSVRGCQQVFHLVCVKQRYGNHKCKDFKCPQHACFICKQKGYWRCMRCTIAVHSKCAPWPQNVIYPVNNSRQVICWRHPEDWRLESKHADPTSDIKEAFCRLPVPYNDVEFDIDIIRKDVLENKMEPTPYVHIKRNLYLIKKKRDTVDSDSGCTNCNSNDLCVEDCVCRVQSISCSKACSCSELCTNRPFRKEKKLKIVKTQYCGWGVEAAEPIKEGTFVIEYIGEVIDDSLCEQRLWDMKRRGDVNFYMCEIKKDFTIDATFKGNASRFLNHSCNPNCKLEKWQADGETRVGVFAFKNVEVGEPLTYDYRFVHFGPKVKCCCGAANCQGYLGSSKKSDKEIVQCQWKSKRKRSRD